MIEIARAAAGDGTLPVDEERLRAEARRIDATSAWGGPVGTAALTIIVGSVLHDVISHGRLAIWTAGIAIGVLGQFASIAVPAIGRWGAPNGLPRVTQAAHLLVGIGYGSLLWLDTSIVGTAEYRWAVLMTMFALSAGVSTRLAGLHSVGLLVIAPVWALGSTALLVDRHWLIGMGGLLFLGVLVVDQRRSGALWRELVALRVDHERRTEEQRRLAEHDALTGLLNRAGVLVRLQSMRGGLSAMFVDLDGFKLVNDEHGHTAGDEILVEVGRRLRSLVRSGDTVARLGGDEFLLLLDRPIAPSSLIELAQRTIELIESPILTTAGVAIVSASIGVDSVEIGAEDAARILGRADRALLQAKRAGRRRVVAFEEPPAPSPRTFAA